MRSGVVSARLIVMMLATLALANCRDIDEGSAGTVVATSATTSATVLAVAQITTSTTVSTIVVSTTAPLAPPAPATSEAPAPAVAAEPEATDLEPAEPAAELEAEPEPEPEAEPEADTPPPTSRRPVNPAPAPTAAPRPTADNSVAGQVIARVNAERKAAGLGPVTGNGTLNAIAAAHSSDQAAHETMTHVGSDGSTLGQRMSRGGYRGSGYGENVAVGYGTADAVMTGWMNSPGHRANVLGNYTQIGVAVARSAKGTLYWTMDLGHP